MDVVVRRALLLVAMVNKFPSRGRAICSARAVSRLTDECAADGELHFLSALFFQDIKSSPIYTPLHATIYKCAHIIYTRMRSESAESGRLVFGSDDVLCATVVWYPSTYISLCVCVCVRHPCRQTNIYTHTQTLGCLAH